MGNQFGWMMAMPLEYSGAVLILAALIVIALGTGVLFAIFKGIEKVGSKDPLTIAKERLARGEITDEEFKSIVKELGSHSRLRS
jgi:uncharacterized membrane protein